MTHQLRIIAQKAGTPIQQTTPQSEFKSMASETRGNKQRVKIDDMNSKTSVGFFCFSLWSLYIEQVVTKLENTDRVLTQPKHVPTRKQERFCGSTYTGFIIQSKRLKRTEMVTEEIKRM